MKRGSILVTEGEIVDAGTPLGQVGLSGKTEFPHLHISLRHNGEVVDPFAPEGSSTCNPTPENTMWADAPDYVAGGLLRLGYDTKVPKYVDVKSGAAGTSTLSSRRARACPLCPRLWKPGWRHAHDQHHRPQRVRFPARSRARENPGALLPRRRQKTPPRWLGRGRLYRHRHATPPRRSLRTGHPNPDHPLKAAPRLTAIVGCALAAHLDHTVVRPVNAPCFSTKYRRNTDVIPTQYRPRFCPLTTRFSGRFSPNSAKGSARRSQTPLTIPPWVLAIAVNVRSA